MRASGPPMRVSGAEPGLKSLRIGSVDGANHGGSMEGPVRRELVGALFCPPLRGGTLAIAGAEGPCPESQNLRTDSPTDSPTVLSLRRKIPLDGPAASANVETCFGSRKTNEAWNPGSFGCRGLRVYGARDFVIARLRRSRGNPVTRRGFLDCFATLAMTIKAGRVTPSPAPAASTGRAAGICSRSHS